MPMRFSPFLIGTTLICSVIAITDLSAKTDWLDHIDTQFEDTFQKTDQAFDRAMKEGVTELDHELASIWGQARQLPDAKVWTGYSQDRKTRIIVDYDKGEMSLESFERNEAELTRDFQDILLENNEQLDERAALRRKLIEKTAHFRNEWPAPSPRMRPDDRPKHKPEIWQDPKPDFQSRPRQERELSRLIAPRTRPTYVKRDVILTKGKRASLSRLSIPLRKDRDRLSAQALRNPVEGAARKYGLAPSLILSVIKNESAFNPRARSHANALGLMQLVATSGGKEAYEYLTGQNEIPGPDILYDPYENIMLGATYLHLLNTRYFGAVKNDLARQYLIISAYNTGAGNVAKAFTGAMKLKPAIQKINTMNAHQIYQHLQQNLPYAETKTYLSRVAKDTKTFASWDA
jgi:membrane-bound lytic murein transglycosylase C